MRWREISVIRFPEPKCEPLTLVWEVPRATSYRKARKVLRVIVELEDLYGGDAYI